MSKKTKKSIIKIKTMINKNKHNISRLIVSEEFMLVLKDYAHLVDFKQRKLKLKQEHSFNGIDNSFEDYIDVDYLWDVPVYLSANITSGAVLEMLNGEFFVLKNI